ncbi:MAG: hybrid sensor histidine kinase/response regulator [Nitrospirae bacterium]|nr:MAG: hybrid sensor histidine kinase/response regulator [Nitrospirota bacterium]
MKVLIVDNDPHIIMVLEEYVKTIEDCLPVSFSSSSAALAWCEDNEPDIVVVDYQMPSPNGMEFIKSLKLLKDRSEVPTVMITGDEDRDVRYTALEIGVNDFVLKPFDYTEFVSRIKNLLSLRRYQKQLSEANRCLHEIVSKEIAMNLQKDRMLRQQSNLAALGKLAASITHEINTPLTYVKGNLEMLKSDLDLIGPDDANQRGINEMFEAIKDGINRIENIIGSMKQITGFSNKKKVLSNVFSTLIYALRITNNRARHITKVYINGEPFGMDMKTERNVFETVISPQSMEQVWMIIINNSLDELQKVDIPFKDRYIKIDIFADGRVIKVVFKDNAGGIRPDIMDGIFDLFMSGKPEYGMGIGLNIAKTIIEDHWGDIKAYNEGSGAVFEVVLPVVFLDGEASVKGQPV